MKTMPSTTTAAAASATTTLLGSWCRKAPAGGATEPLNPVANACLSLIDAPSEERR